MPPDESYEDQLRRENQEWMEQLFGPIQVPRPRPQRPITTSVFELGSIHTSIMISVEMPGRERYVQRTHPVPEPTPIPDVSLTNTGPRKIKLKHDPSDPPSDRAPGGDPD